MRCAHPTQGAGVARQEALRQDTSHSATGADTRTWPTCKEVGVCVCRCVGFLACVYVSGDVCVYDEVSMCVRICVCL